MYELVNLYTYEREKNTRNLHSVACLRTAIRAVLKAMLKLLIYSEITNYAKAYLPVPVLIVR